MSDVAARNRRSISQRIKRKRARRPTSCRGQLEWLEDRRLLAVWSGPLSDGTVWGGTPGEVEVIDGTVSVPDGTTLTIRAGTVVKASSSFGVLEIAGQVITEGSADEPIHFTSIRDDSVGGDTNGDGAATTPAPGNWRGLRLTAATAEVQLTHVQLRYTGALQSSALQVDAGQLSLDHVGISNSNSTALQFNAGASGLYNLDDVSISDIGTLTTHHGVFVNSTDATINATNLTIHNVRGQHVRTNNAANWNSTGTSLTGTGITAIAFAGASTITDTRAWDDTAVYLLSNGITVASGASLTLPAGMVVKAESFGRLTVQGNLTVTGTAPDPVTITSLHDDTVGGDTNGNGAASSPAAGNWQNLLLSGTNAHGDIDRLQVRYSGRSAIEMTDGTLHMRDSLVTDATNHGISLTGGDAVLERNTIRDVGDFGLNIQTATGAVTLTDTTIENAADGAYMADPKTELVASGTVATSSGRAGAIVIDGIGSPNIEEDLLWQENLTYLVFDSVTILADADLTIVPGTVVKFPNSRIFNVGGELKALGTVAQPIIFTVLEDDSAGGDTNGDGGATLPESAAGYSLNLNGGSANLDLVEIRYLNAGAVFVNEGYLNLTNSLVRNTTGTLNPAVRINVNADGVNLFGTTIRDVTGHGVLIATTSDAPIVLASITVENAGGYGVFTHSQANVDLSGATFSNTTSDGAVLVQPATAITGTRFWAGGLTYVFNTFFRGNLTVDQTGNLTIGAGAVLKFGQHAGVQNDGTLNALGTPADPVIFTSIKDDVGGDSNQDGDTTMPAAGDWFSYWHRDGFRATQNTAQSLLENVQIRYAGVEPGAPTPAVLIDGGTFTASNLLVEHVLDAGFRSRWSSQNQVTVINLTIRDTAAEGLSFGLTAPGGGGVSLDGVHLEDIFGDAVTIDPELVSPVISNLTMTNVQGLRGERVVNDVVRQDLTLGYTGLVVLEQGLDIQTGGAIEFLSGTIVKVADGASVHGRNGPVVAQGTPRGRVLFTSMRDDAAGGDTNGDGATTMPAAGDWGGVKLEVAGSVLDQVEIRYAGGLGAGLVVAIDDPKLSNLIVHDVTGSAVEIAADPELLQVLLYNFQVAGIVQSIVLSTGSPPDLRVVNSTIVGGEFGIQVQAGGVVELTNTIITGASTAGISFDTFESVEVIMQHNLFFNPAATGGNQQDLRGTATFTDAGGNLTGDPLFQNLAGANFTPALGSPAIDSGLVNQFTPLSDIDGKSAYNFPSVLDTGEGFFSYRDIGVSELWNGISEVELVLGSIQFEVDDDNRAITITTPVTNLGQQSTADVTNVWTDEYFLVEVPEQRGSEVILLGSVIRTQEIGPGGQLTNIDSFPYLPIPSASYAVRVHTDVDDTLRQPSAGATATSEQTFNHQNPQLPQNGVTDGELPSGFIRPLDRYDFEVPPGCALRIQLDGDAENTSAFFNFPAAAPARPLHPGGSVLVPNPGEKISSGTVSVVGPFGDRYRITTQLIKQELSTVTPNTIGNAGDATVTITGGPFEDTQFALVATDGTTIPSVRTREFADGGTVAVTFPGGLGYGAYDLQATFKGLPGFFNAAQNFPPNLGPIRSLAIADFNGDGNNDIATAGDDVAVHLTNGDGNIIMSNVITSNPTGYDNLVTADMENDGDMDIIVTGTNGNDIVLLSNDGNSVFTSQVIDANANGVNSLIVGDANQDGNLDLYTAANGGINAYLNSGGGTFQRVTVATVGNRTYTIISSYVDEGGRENLVSALDDGNISVHQNIGVPGTVVFAPPITINTNAGGGVRVAVGDVNGDGNQDVIIAGNDTVSVQYNEGNNTFSPPTSIAQDPLGGNVHINTADVDLNGTDDVVLLGDGGDTVTTLISGGDGSFTLTNIDTNVGGGVRVATGDINGDGAVDIVVGGDSGIRINPNRGPVITRLDEGVTVIDGGPGDTTITLDGPDQIRPGFPNRYTLTWQNNGSTDATTSAINVSFPPGVSASLTPNGVPLANELLFFSFVPNSTNNLSVPPGAMGSTNLYLTSQPGIPQLDVDIGSIPLDHPSLESIVPNWNDFLDPSGLLPDGADPARFNEMAGDVQQLLGDTLGSILQGLAENAVVDLTGEVIDGERPDLDARRDAIAGGVTLMSASSADMFARFYPKPQQGSMGDGVHQDFVIIIAIEDYSNVPGAKNLPGTQSDLQHLLDFYRNELRIGEDQITVLRDLPGKRDDDMTFDKIEQAWRDTVGKADEDDKIKVHFSGHGVNQPGFEGALIMNDHDSARGITFAFSGRRLKGMFENDPMPGETLFVADSCFSGGLKSNLDDIPNTRWEAACSADETTKDKKSFTKDWVRNQRDLKNDLDKDDRVTLLESFEATQIDRIVEDGTFPQAGGDPSVNQKLHDDLGEAAKKFERLAAAILDSLPVRVVRRILNFFGIDPNEKTGPVGVGAENYRADAGTLDYKVYFENDPELANAPAQFVTITDQLSPDLDWDTFQFGEVAFGSNTFLLDGTSELSSARVFDFQTGDFADVQARFDRSSGLVTWTFSTIDPRTGERTLDPLAGFLPPNVTSPEGEGHISFSIRPNSDVTSGSVITNSASIVFDTNDPIITNEHVITFDFDPPTSSVDALPDSSQVLFAVSWSGTDADSEIASYDIFVSEDGGPFTLWMDDTPDTSAPYIGQPGRIYAFYSVATDLVGHVEPAPAMADATTTIVADASGPVVIQLQINSGLADPQDLPIGPQPTNWQQQRSQLRTVAVTFNEPVASIAANQLVLTNLGVNAPVDDDTVIPLSDQHLVLTGPLLTINFESGELPDGVYQLTIQASVTDLAGNPLDGNGDGIAGDDYLVRGNINNRLYRLFGDWNGDFGVSIFDFPIFAYWFGRSVPNAPEYMDLNEDTGITIFDFPFFAARFGSRVVFPVGLASLAGQVAEPNRAVLARVRLDPDSQQVPRTASSDNWIMFRPPGKRDSLAFLGERVDQDPEPTLDLEQVLDSIGSSVQRGWQHSNDQ